MFENEEWRPIQEFKNYTVSNYGRVKHIERITPREVTVNKQGFPLIMLKRHDGPTRYLRQVNKLVALSFLDPPASPDLNAIWHIDGDLLNCRADNLMWDMRGRVLEWNTMHRRGEPKYKTPPVQNNATGQVYSNAYECALFEGLLESSVVYLVEQTAASMFDPNSKYQYVSSGA